MSKRRTATDADLQVGTLVFRGSGKVQYEVAIVRPNTTGTVDRWNNPTPTGYLLQRVGTVRGASKVYWASDLEIEDRTGVDTLKSLLSF